MADTSEEKEHEPSAKKKADTRKKGTVAKSTEVNSVLVLLAAIFLLRITGPWIMDELEGVTRGSIAQISTTDMSFDRLLSLSQSAILLLLKLILPFVGAIMLVGVIANLIQIGWLFTVEPIMPKLEKISPMKGLTRMFSMRSVVETIKSILKIAIIGYVAYDTVSSEFPLFVVLGDMSVMAIWQTILVCTFDIFIRTAIVLIFIAALDLWYQRYAHTKQIKMSHQEVKEEHKQMDGDPKVKARIRKLQSEMARRRMMGNVPQASVVVTNPTHIAIALQYDDTKNDAPVVVAKGLDLIAQRIKKIAEENNVPLYENKPLARAMYDKVEIGLPIPQEFFVAVAEIMASVYKMKGRA